jgi:putative addiction module component (TIGR02574 family)
MELTTEQIFEAALALPRETKFELAEALFESEPPARPNLHPDWQAELDRRADELLSGEVEGIPAEEVMKRVKGMLNERRSIPSGGA